MNSPSADLIRIALTALLVGVTLPLLVQLFMTVRTLQRTLVQMDRRLDETMRDVSRLVDRVEQRTASGDGLATIGAALVPAALAAVRALRTHGPADTQPEDTDGEAR